MVSQQELDYYATPGRMTDLSSVELGEIPERISGICALVQGLMIHPFWLGTYGVEVPDERQEELQIRPADRIVAKIRELDPAPLSEPRPPERRVLGNCRDFSTLTIALLRRQGVPARARCGFGLYFQPGFYIDHWVVEWWIGDAWHFTDAQLDQTQRTSLGLTFDPLDTPRDQFIDAGRAWQRYRAGDVPGDRFGVLDMFGPEFIRGNLLRDAASLNKMEMLPWDGWGPLTDDEAFYDELAPVTVAADFDEVRKWYDDERVHVPEEVVQFWPETKLVRL